MFAKRDGGVSCYFNGSERIIEKKEWSDDGALVFTMEIKDGVETRTIFNEGEDAVVIRISKGGTLHKVWMGLDCGQEVLIYIDFAPI